MTAPTILRRIIERKFAEIDERSQARSLHSLQQAAETADVGKAQRAKAVVFVARRCQKYILVLLVCVIFLLV